MKFNAIMNNENTIFKYRNVFRKKYFNIIFGPED